MLWKENKNQAKTCLTASWFFFFFMIFLFFFLNPFGQAATFKSRCPLLLDIAFWGEGTRGDGGLHLALLSSRCHDHQCLLFLWLVCSLSRTFSSTSDPSTSNCTGSDGVPYFLPDHSLVHFLSLPNGTTIFEKLRVVLRNSHPPWTQTHLSYL